MLHARFAAPSARSDETSVVQLPGRRLGILEPRPDGQSVELLADDHPVLLLLDEVDRLRGQLEDREAEIGNLRGDLSHAYDRECDLVRILHRYVLAEQVGQERRRWWAPGGRALRS